MAARRAARRARDGRAARQQQHAERVKGDRGEASLPEHASPDAVWAARKDRLQLLLNDDGASAAELKRELRRLLGYADALRETAKDERAELAAELHELVAPLVMEVSRL